jgi:hypothetical protein
MGGRLRRRPFPVAKYHVCGGGTPTPGSAEKFCAKRDRLALCLRHCTGEECGVRCCGASRPGATSSFAYRPSRSQRLPPSIAESRRVTILKTTGASGRSPSTTPYSPRLRGECRTDFRPRSGLWDPSGMPATRLRKRPPDRASGTMRGTCRWAPRPQLSQATRTFSPPARGASFLHPRPPDGRTQGTASLRGWEIAGAASAATVEAVLNAAVATTRAVSDRAAKSAGMTTVHLILMGVSPSCRWLAGPAVGSEHVPECPNDNGDRRDRRSPNPLVKSAQNKDQHQCDGGEFHWGGPSDDKGVGGGERVRLSECVRRAGYGAVRKTMWNSIGLPHANRREGR